MRNVALNLTDSTYNAVNLQDYFKIKYLETMQNVRISKSIYKTKKNEIRGI